MNREETMVEQFIQYLRYERNYSSHTVLAYKKDLEQFSLFLSNEYHEQDLSQADADMIRFWLLSLMESGVSARSVNRKLSSLKSFWRFLQAKGYVKENPTRGVLSPKVHKSLPSFLKAEEMDALLEESSAEDDSGSPFVEKRNRLMIEMLLQTGMRRSELMGLALSDVDMSSCLLRVKGKRDKQRLIPFGPMLQSMIQDYLQSRNQWQAECEGLYEFSDCLFVRENGRPLYPQLVYRLVHDTLSKSSTLAKKSPHVLRHTFATTLLNNGAELNAVKELLGHANLSATEVYTHTTFEELKKVYKQAHPRADY